MHHTGSNGNNPKIASPTPPLPADPHATPTTGSFHRSNIKRQRLGRLLPNPVPVQLAGQHHEHTQQPEQQQRAHQQRVILGTQQAIKQSVQRRQSRRKTQAVAHAAQHVADIKPDQQHTTTRRQQIRQGKTDVLGQRQQQQVEERQRYTDQRILDRMHRQAFQHFKQEETGKRQDDEQQRI